MEMMRLLDGISRPIRGHDGPVASRKLHEVEAEPERAPRSAWGTMSLRAVGASSGSLRAGHGVGQHAGRHPAAIHGHDAAVASRKLHERKGELPRARQSASVTMSFRT